MVKKLNPIQARETLTNKGMVIFTPLQFRELFNVSKTAAQKFIHQHTQKGLFTKLRNSLYSLKDQNIPAFHIANKIYSPSYISLESALSYYNILPETVYEITSVTAKPNREFKTLDLSFTYSRIKKSVFCGYRLCKHDEHSFLMAKPEKALADYLYLVSLNKRPLNQRLDTSKINKTEMKKWINLFNSSKLEKLTFDICLHPHK